ncbi:MAG TPA: FKBP-type peptidyl-prolyl cis-trans isomerase [Chitinophagaceae bacterium]|nr:FKBP-type peptidyl-prolyl cis-trans isomerase [Chitinophagaceae bacterium]
MIRNILAAACIFLGLSGCLKDNASVNPCIYDECALKAPANEIQDVQAYLNTNGISNATQHCSGLFYRVAAAGSGKTPNICSTVSAFYTGRFTNGNVFDQTTTTPANFPLNSVIEGWKKGLPLIKEGGKIFLYIPPTLAYGSAGRSGIPPNAILIFEIDLQSVF